MAPYLVAFAVSFVAGLGFTPLVREFTIRRRLVAAPGQRTIHAGEIPTLGGLAIAAGFFVSQGTVYLAFRQGFPGLAPLLVGLLLGSLVILVLGVYDDVRQASPLAKVLFQIVGAYVLVRFGYSVQYLASPFGGSLLLGGWSTPLTILWILVLSNALNLVDGLDGLAAGISVIIGLSLLVTGLRLGNHTASLFMASLAGVSLGFLPYNFYPARIFMGDTGSLFLGFVFGAASVLGASKSAATVAFLIPIVALGIPILDTAVAIVRRTSRGRHFYRADKEHIHHKLLGIGFSHPQVVLILCGFSVLLGVLAIALSTADRRVIFWFVVLTVLVCLAALRRLWTQSQNHRRDGSTEA
jgi:UDP-GlcNAc:undecaprenyl-phosphate GlcNAc-1-phosphate transferase